jgi:hypothetical protein
MDQVRNKWMAGMCAAVLASAGAVVAQDQGGDFSKPLSRGHAQAQPAEGSGESRVLLRSEQDGDTYEVSIINGEVTAKVNGKAVPAERVRRSKDKIEILDKKGNVVQSFNVSLDNGWGAGGAAGGGKGAHGGKVAPHAMTFENQPKVMIGITMGQPSDALAEHLGIKPDEAVVIEKVYDGLPADKAGLKAQDIITEVDGVHPVTQQNFRETINKKEPGDKVTLRILRKGEEQKVTVELKKFDAEKLGMEGMPEEKPNPFPPGWENMQGNQEWIEQMKKALKEGGANGQAWVWGPGQEGQQFRFAPPGGADGKRLDEMQAQIDKKISELDEKIAKVNEQMARLERLLNKMSEKSEKKEH